MNPFVYNQINFTRTLSPLQLHGQEACMHEPCIVYKSVNFNSNLSLLQLPDQEACQDKPLAVYNRGNFNWILSLLQLSGQEACLNEPFIVYKRDSFNWILSLLQLPGQEACLDEPFIALSEEVGQLQVLYEQTVFQPIISFPRFRSNTIFNCVFGSLTTVKLYSKTMSLCKSTHMKSQNKKFCRVANSAVYLQIMAGSMFFRYNFVQYS